MVLLNAVLALSATASALTFQSLTRRDAADVFNIFSVIEQSYSRGTLIADAQSFDGSLLGALNFQQQVDIVTVSLFMYLPQGTLRAPGLKI